MAVLQTLLTLTVYSAVIYCAIMLFRIFLKKHISPVLIYLVWFLMIARLVIPVTLDTGLRFFTLPVGQAQTVAGDTTATDSSAVDPAGIPAFETENNRVAYPVQTEEAAPARAENPAVESAEVPSEIAGDTSLPPAGNKKGFSPDPVSILLLIWISGIVLGAAHISLAFVRMRKRLTCGSVPVAPVIEALAAKIKQELKLCGNIKIAALSGIASPALTAGFRPVVLIPPDFAVWSPEVTEFALRHELMHYRRGDHLVCLLLVILRAAHWFNPVVWLAAKQMKMDMESACDCMVVACMNEERKKCYANTILNMYAGEKGTRLLMGMALENTRKTAERRIRGIFMRPKSGIRAKITAFFLAALLLIACFTTACQPVMPESGIPGSSTPLPSQSQATQSDSPARLSYEAPASYKKSFDANDDRVHISMDAEVVLPDAAQIPVLQTTPQDVTVDLVKKAAGVLMEGKTMYEPLILTKSEIQAQIDALQNILDDPAGSSTGSLTDPSYGRYTASDLQIDMDQYRLWLQDAPDAYTPREAEFEFHNSAYYYEPAAADNGGGTAEVSGGDAVASASATAEEKISGEDETDSIEDQRKNGKLMRLQARLDGGFYGEITASSYNGKNMQTNSLSFAKSRFMYLSGNVFQIDRDNYQPSTINQEEAYRMALDLLERLGITDMKLNSCRPAGLFGVPADPQAKTVYGYFVEFVRTYGPVPLLSYNGEYDSLAEEYDYSNEYETVRIMINEDQITSFSWQQISGPTQIAEQNPVLLPFDRVIDIFKKTAADAYGPEKLTQYYQNQGNPRYLINWNATGNQILEGFEEGSLIISRIELGYALVKDDASGSRRLVPAWKFYGSDQVTSEVNGVKDVFPSTQTPINTYMTINAVDGSILDGKPD